VTHLGLDHLRYIQSQAYRREVHGRLRRLIADEPGAISQMTVVHEAGDSCCLREAWPVTYARLLAALAADGEPVLGVVL
jgi:hypothetical protein